MDTFMPNIRVKLQVYKEWSSDQSGVLRATKGLGKARRSFDDTQGSAVVDSRQLAGECDDEYWKLHADNSEFDDSVFLAHFGKIKLSN